jgi:bacterioferritin
MPTTPDARTLGWLQRALTHEMRAVQQYLAQGVLARLWGDATLAAEFRREAIEELEHAERLMERLICSGVAPGAAALPPARLGRQPAELLAADLDLEVEAVRLYMDALGHARRQRDAESALLFENLLAEEQRHVQELVKMKMEPPHGSNA